MEYIVCPICELDDTRPFIPLGPHDIVRCQHCGLVYVNPRRPQAKTKSFFVQNYVPRKEMLQKEFGNWRADTLQREASLIRALKAPGQILDVGCAGGEFLKHFLSAGWECYGVEPSILASQVAQQLGIHVYQNVLQEVNLTSEYFDVITILDTFPFHSDPYDDLKKVHHALKRDGLLVIEIPGLTYRLLRNVGPVSLLAYHRWCHLSSLSPHLFYFSTNSLRRLLCKAGFQIVHVVLEQAPQRGHIALRWLNQAHFTFSRALFNTSLGRMNLAAKVVYVCQEL